MARRLFFNMFILEDEDLQKKRKIKPFNNLSFIDLFLGRRLMFPVADLSSPLRVLFLLIGGGFFHIQRAVSSYEPNTEYIYTHITVVHMQMYAENYT